MEKETHSDGHSGSDEKIGAVGTEVAHEGRRASVADSARRESVALNIVENPLKVSLAEVASPLGGRRQDVNANFAALQ